MLCVRRLGVRTLAAGVEVLELAADGGHTGVIGVVGVDLISLELDATRVSGDVMAVALDDD